MRLLGPSDGHDAALRSLLLETILEELQEWDGQCICDNEQRRISGSLRLCCVVDSVSGRVSVTLRCRTSEDFPDGGFVLLRELRAERMACKEHAMGWSTELFLDGNQGVFDASSLDWTQGVIARSGDGAWIFRLPASPVRVFQSGAPHSLPGLVESGRLPRQTDFYLACNDSAEHLIRTWGSSSCAEFEELRIESGLPPGWKLYWGRNVQSDRLVRDAFPILTLNETVRLHFDGGIQHARNRYFTFALPQLVLDGSETGITVNVNNVSLRESQRRSFFEIPSEVVLPGRVLVDARRGHDVVVRRSFYVSDDLAATPIAPMWCDAFGKCVEDENRALVCGSLVRAPSQRPQVFFSPEINSFRGTIFVGRRPGEIESLPQGRFPTEWEPVWAISKGRRSASVFCGTNVRGSEPQTERIADLRRVEAWKEVMWYRRRRITPPPHPALNSLWELYQKVAEKL
jgi:hypothetical protein